jgi:multiple sugar transport system permease protein/raffinose/stachyose/melibiose transport system permease protein
MNTSDKMKRDNQMGWLFVTPALIVIGIFVFISIIFGLVISFTKVNLFTGDFSFIGFKNYARIFTDSKSKIAFFNTTKFVLVVVPLQTIFSLIIAATLNAKLHGTKVFRTIYFLPTLTSSAALTMIFMFIFSLTGPINNYAVRLGLLSESINFLNNKSFALQVIMAMNIWSTVPFFMTIYLAGLMDIPKSIYEAAEVDGASPVQKFWNITVPSLRPITTYVILLGIIGTFQMFDQAYIFSNGTGGPENSTLTVALLIYKNAFGQNNTMGFASAMALGLAIVIFTVSAVERKIDKSDEV